MLLSSPEAIFSTYGAAAGDGDGDDHSPPSDEPLVLSSSAPTTSLIPDKEKQQEVAATVCRQPPRLPRPAPSSSPSTVLPRSMNKRAPSPSAPTVYMARAAADDSQVERRRPKMMMDTLEMKQEERQEKEESEAEGKEGKEKEKVEKEKKGEGDKDKWKENENPYSISLATYKSVDISLSSSALPTWRGLVNKELKSKTEERWDTVMKEQRPLCKQQHFCTIRDPQHWMEFRHSLSSAEVTAKIRALGDQGNFSGATMGSRALKEDNRK